MSRTDTRGIKIMNQSVLIDVLGLVTKGYGNGKCRMLSIVVDFMILSDIYCLLF